MAKYFMGGTRYEKFERMMMEPRKGQKPLAPRREPPPAQKSPGEKERGR